MAGIVFHVATATVIVRPTAAGTRRGALLCVTTVCHAAARAVSASSTFRAASTQEVTDWPSELVK